MDRAATPLLMLAMLAALLVSVGIEDARRREIANWKNAAVALLAPLWWWSNALPWPDIGWQIGVALAVFALFCVAFHFGQMGGGDVKLLGALALWFPLQPLVAMLLAMSVIGGGLTVILVVERRIRRGGTGAMEIPYGVAIAIAALLEMREPLFNHFT